MKKLYKIFWAVATVMATMVGCTETDVEELTATTENEPAGTFRVAASTSSKDGSQTKVNIDGTEVTWDENDCISIAEVGENGEFVSSSEYQIDASTISENGKYAEFVGPDLYEDRSYIAYNYPGYGSVVFNSNYGINNYFECSYSYMGYNPDNIDLVMQSSPFEYDGINTPEFKFEHKSAILNLVINLSEGIESNGNIESVIISNNSGHNVFLSSLVFDSSGEALYPIASNYVMGENSQYQASNFINVKINGTVAFSNGSSLSIPISWNNYLSDDIEGDFVFTIINSEGKIAECKKPLRKLEKGTLYTANLTVDKLNDQKNNDREILTKIYHALGGDEWIDNTNWLTEVPLDEWSGVRINNNGFVDYIYLVNNNLKGDIPDEIGDLHFLTTLYLDGNAEISGEIPETIGNLQKLEWFSLSACPQISGNIPATIGNCTNMRGIYMQGCALSGEIPESIGNLINLECLFISDSEISGEIPESIGNLVNLNDFRLSNTKISGEIPASIGNMTNLEVLYLGANNLSGNIPSSIGNLYKLRCFEANHNDLSGSIPETIGSLINLERLRLDCNNFTGSIPSTIGSLEKLESLILQLNNLSGSIPSTISEMKNIKELDLLKNNLTGELPISMGDLKNIERINLQLNNLSGAIPESFCNLSNLKFLNLACNSFSGTLPEMLGANLNLENAILRNNNFTGKIPNSLTSRTDWNKVGWDIIGQKAGYGFDKSSYDLYIEPSNIVTIDNQLINTQNYFKENELTGIVYWHSYCEDSKQFLDYLKETYQTYTKDGFSLISINDESDNIISEYIKSNNIPGISCRIEKNANGELLDDSYNRIKYFPDLGTPTFAIFDKQGKMVFSIETEATNISGMQEKWTEDFLKTYFDDNLELDDTDYTHDGEIVTLQTASVGNGVDLVIVGDGFDDTTMETGGEYETRAKEAMEHFFSEEPYATLRDRYNVYAVKAVSIDDGVEEENKTTFGTQFLGGTAIAGNDDKIFKYAMLVPEISSTEDLTVLAVVNSDVYAGTCYMYNNNASVAYCPIVANDAEQFRQIVTHECGGHGFAKLLDEYCYEGTIPDWAIADYEMQRDLGWGANVDITDDPATIQWAHFLSDPLYDGQVGIYEGALTFEFGAYRPTDTSIMRYNVGGYNAPSREAIYKRIMELSGEVYSYEKFVEYDAINRTPSAKAYRAAAARRVNEAAFTPLARPVVVKGSPKVHK